jgi:hypothetical protein
MLALADLLGSLRRANNAEHRVNGTAPRHSTRIAEDSHATTLSVITAPCRANTAERVSIHATQTPTPA